MSKLNKRALLTFNALLTNTDFCSIGSCFHIEGKNSKYVIPSAMLRRNFPQAKTNTRLKIQIFPWAVDVGRTIWFKRDALFICYTFSRSGKSVTSNMPDYFAEFLIRNLSIRPWTKERFKMVVTAI